MTATLLTLHLLAAITVGLLVAQLIELLVIKLPRRIMQWL